MPKDTIELGNEQLSVYEFARWAALLEAVELIAGKCEERGIDFDGPAGLRFIKPLDIQDYVNGRTDSMVVTVEKSREFERRNTFVQLEKIKQHIYEFNTHDIGLPV